MKMLVTQEGIIMYGGEHEEQLEWENVNILNVKSVEEGKKSAIFKLDINKASDQKLCFSILYHDAEEGEDDSLDFAATSPELRDQYVDAFRKLHKFYIAEVKRNQAAAAETAAA